MLKLATPLMALCLIFSLPLFTKAQSCDPIDRLRLRNILVELGYEVKDIVRDAGKEKFSVTMTKDGLDVPIGYEISPSGSYIWLTVNLGKPSADSANQALSLVKQNAIIQPCLFYITKSGTLMLGLPIENRGVTNALIRKLSDVVTNRVSETRNLWQVKQ